MYVLVCAGLVFLMQLGFTLIECGGVRPKNTAHTLILNLFDSVVGLIGFWLVGYGLAYGNVKSFAGNDGRFFATSADHPSIFPDPYVHFVFQFSFCTTAATLVSGSLAERTKIPAYIGFTFIMSTFVYPIVVAWCWGNGWL